jgi:hypothetical protein
MSLIAVDIDCGGCDRSGMQKVSCSCHCSRCKAGGTARYSTGWEWVSCTECNGTGKKWFGRCSKCATGKIRQTCSICGGGGRDLNCPKCKGVDKRPCWCAEAGLRSVKQVELGSILALLPEVENSIKFYDNDNPYSTTVAPAQVLSYVQLAEVLRRERAYVRGHTCAMKRGCKVNWLQPNVPGAVEHTTTSVLLTAYDSDSSRRTSGREIHRVGSDQFIDIGSFGDGVREFNWDAGQRALINKAS